MKVFILSLLINYAFCISYQNLSIEHTKKAYDKIDLTNLNSKANPGDLGALRKSLLLVRTYLDIFAYAYPFNSSIDIFKILRSDLNYGYTKIGDFDDLRFVNYTSSDREKLLDECLKWKHQFEVDSNEYQFERYSHDVGSRLYFRDKNELSIDFWGRILEIPSNNLTGYQNLATLSSGQLTECLKEYQKIIGLTEIWKNEYHDQFHDYRKLIRGILFIPNFFAPVYSGNTDEYTNVLSGAYDKFGKLNDVINEYEYYQKKGDSGKAEEKQRDVIKLWKNLKEWMDSTNLVGAIKGLLGIIISF